MPREPLATTEVAVAQADILVGAQGGETVDHQRIVDCGASINGVGEMADVLVALANELDERWLRPQMGDKPVLVVAWHGHTERSERRDHVEALGNTVLSYAHSRGSADRAAIDTAVAQAGQQLAWDLVVMFSITAAQLRAR